MASATQVLTALALFAAFAQCFAYYTPDTKLCMAYGDPHFNTFDERTLHFQGNCTYLLAGVCCDAGWQVYVSASRCDPWWTAAAPRTCVDRVIVKINGYTIHMFRSGFNWVFPWPLAPYPGFTYFDWPGLTRVVTDDGVEISYIRPYTVKVKIPCKYFNKTCGLCGNADDDWHNDYLTSTGDDPDDADDWGSSYQIQQYDWTCDRRRIINPLPVTSARRQAQRVESIEETVQRLRDAQQLGECQNIDSPPDQWKVCFDRMSANVSSGLLESCVIDMISGDAKAEDACPVLDAVADFCFELAPEVNHWKPDACRDEKCALVRCKEGHVCRVDGTGNVQCVCEGPLCTVAREDPGADAVQQGVA